MSAASPDFDVATAMDHFADDDSYYETPNGDSVWMRQQNWTAIDLSIGGYLKITYMDLYNPHRNHTPMRND